MYFPKFSAQTRLLSLPAPHELPPREVQEYPPYHVFLFHSTDNMNIFALRKKRIRNLTFY